MAGCWERVSTGGICTATLPKLAPRPVIIPCVTAALLFQTASHHAPPDGSPCIEEKRVAVRAGDESGIPIFVPECREDGGYKQVQCHKGDHSRNSLKHTSVGTGYCWCVNDDGKPVPGSSVQHSQVQSPSIPSKNIFDL